jgi:tetrahydromethanopterin S-methyltransferase subunit G
MKTATTDRELKALRARVEELESLCSEMYQVAGAAGAPVRVLDKLLAASEGNKLPSASLLPIDPEDFDEVATREAAINRVVDALGPRFAARVGRLGGQATTEAKRRASRANGRKGGRPGKRTTGR